MPQCGKVLWWCYQYYYSNPSICGFLINTLWRSRRITNSFVFCHPELSRIPSIQTTSYFLFRSPSGAQKNFLIHPINFRKSCVFRSRNSNIQRFLEKWSGVSYCWSKSTFHWSEENFGPFSQKCIFWVKILPQMSYRRLNVKRCYLIRINFRAYKFSRKFAQRHQNVRNFIR